MPSWEIKLRDKETGKIMSLATDGTPALEDRTYILPGTSGHLLTQEHLANPANFPVEFISAIKGTTGDGIESIVFISTTDASGVRGKAGASDTYQIVLNTGEKSDFVVTNGQTNAELTTMIQAALETVIGSAPAALDTLAEIAAAIGNNADFYNSVIQAISTKADSSSVYAKNEIDGMVAGLKTIPQNSKTAAYVLAATDGGNSIDTNSNVTIPTANTVNFVIGTTINITNISSGSLEVIAAGGVTLRQSGSTSTGNLIIPAYSSCTIRKVASDTWFISETICMYSKGEIESFITAIDEAILTKADADNVYTKAEIGNLLGFKANADSVYTKSQIDTAFLTKADVDDVYSKTVMDTTIGEINTALGSKANSSNTYTKTEVDIIATGKLGSTATAAAATKLATSRTFTLSGDVSGSAAFDGTGNPNIAVTVSNDSHTHTFANLTSKPTTIAGYSISDAYTKTETDSRIQAVVGAAPAALDTLVEIAAQLANDESAVSSLVVTVSGKADSSSVYTKTQIDTALALKADASTTYTKSQVDTSLSLKADAATTYSMAQVNTFVASLKTIPQVLKTATYTLALTDGGGAVDTSAGVTVPANATVAFPIGSIVTVTNTSAAAIVITQGAGVTLRQAATANTGNRTLAAYGVCSIRKIASDTWMIIGAGIS